MTQEGDATFQEVFSMASSTDAIKLLPWCLTSAVPFHYIGEALATAMQQGENSPTTTAAPKVVGSMAGGPSSSPAHPTETLPPLILLLLDIPFVVTPPVGHPYPEFIASPTPEKWDGSSSSSLGNHCDKRTHIGSQKVEVRNEHNSAWVMKTCKKYWRRVWASCRLSKGNIWTKAQLKRISNSCEDLWGHNHENIRTEQKCTLAVDCNSFEM